MCEQLRPALPRPAGLGAPLADPLSAQPRGVADAIARNLGLVATKGRLPKKAVVIDQLGTTLGSQPGLRRPSPPHPRRPPGLHGRARERRGHEGTLPPPLLRPAAPGAAGVAVQPRPPRLCRWALAEVPREVGLALREAGPSPTSPPTRRHWPASRWRPSPPLHHRRGGHRRLGRHRERLRRVGAASSRRAAAPATSSGWPRPLSERSPRRPCSPNWPWPPGCWPCTTARSCHAGVRRVDVHGAGGALAGRGAGLAGERPLAHPGGKAGPQGQEGPGPAPAQPSRPGSHQRAAVLAALAAVPEGHAALPGSLADHVVWHAPRRSWSSSSTPVPPGSRSGSALVTPATSWSRWTTSTTGCSTPTARTGRSCTFPLAVIEWASLDHQQQLEARP